MRRPVMYYKRGLSWDLVCEALDTGADFGWNRAHKHTETPTEFEIKEQIKAEILNALCDRFEFEDDAEEFEDDTTQPEVN